MGRSTADKAGRASPTSDPALMSDVKTQPAPDSSQASSDVTSQETQSAVMALSEQVASAEVEAEDVVVVKEEAGEDPKLEKPVDAEPTPVTVPLERWEACSQSGATTALLTPTEYPGVFQVASWGNVGGRDDLLEDRAGQHVAEASDDRVEC